MAYGIGQGMFLSPAKNVSVLGGGRIKLVYLKNEPAKISKRQSKE